MDIQNNIISNATAPKDSGNSTETPQKLPGATVLSPLELNNIRLDVHHTVLTPDYLEKISSGSA